MTKRIARQAQSLSAQRFGRAVRVVLTSSRKHLARLIRHCLCGLQPPLPHEPRESVVAVATAEDDVVGVAKSPQRSKYTSHGHFLAVGRRSVGSARVF